MAKKIEELKFNGEGTCPICGSGMVEYDSVELDCDRTYYPCTCEKCGTTWNECYTIKFNTVDDVVTSDGEEYNTYCE